MSLPVSFLFLISLVSVCLGRSPRDNRMLDAIGNYIGDDENPLHRSAGRDRGLKNRHSAADRHQQSVIIRNCKDAESCTGRYAKIDGIECFGYKACKGANIETKNAPPCPGAGAGDGSGLGAGGGAGGPSKRRCISKGGILAYGGMAAMEAKLVSGIQLMAFGYYSAYKADVYALRVVAAGYQALRSAMVFAEPTKGRTTIIAQGYYSMYQASVKCYAGQKCKVDCQGSTSCIKLFYYCYAGSSCTLKCQWGRENCPLLYNSRFGTDGEIDDQFAVNQLRAEPLDEEAAKLAMDGMEGTEDTLLSQW